MDMLCIDRLLGLSLMVVLLLAVALYGFWSRQVFGLWDSPEVARQGYARLTGFTAPEELEEGMLWSLAGRKLVVLEETGVPEDELGLSAIVFHPGSLGGRPGPRSCCAAWRSACGVSAFPTCRWASGRRRSTARRPAPAPGTWATAGGPSDGSPPSPSRARTDGAAGGGRPLRPGGPDDAGGGPVSGLDGVLGLFGLTVGGVALILLALVVLQVVAIYFGTTLAVAIGGVMVLF